MWGKLSNSQRALLIGIGVLTIVVIIMWANVAKLKNPYSRFEDAINAGDVKTALNCYKEMNGNSQKNNRFEAQKLGLKYLKIRVGDYMDGKADYEPVAEEVYALKETVLAKEDQTDIQIECMEDRHASESAFVAGEEAKAAGDYEKAKEYYEQVSEKYEEYAKAQAAIEECDDLQEVRARQVVEEAMLMIDVDFDIHTYLKAIEHLDNYIKEHPEDNFVPARKTQFMDEYYNIQLINVKTLIMNKEPEEALKLAKELKEFHPDRKETDEYIKQLEETLSKKNTKKK